jgi:hypothetical protein
LTVRGSDAARQKAVPAREATVPDRSLDDFIDGTDDPSDATDDGDGAVDGDAEDGGPDASDGTAADADDPPAADAPTATLRFDPDGVACAACGATVERRWTDADGRPVCVDCKAWGD